MLPWSSLVTAYTPFPCYRKGADFANPSYVQIHPTCIPVSFTLASHVAIFIAMFISPAMAVAVSLGTTLGFFLAGFPLTVVLRALTHVIFALAGAIYLKKHDNAPIQSVRSSLGFSFVIGVLHAFCEVLVVLPFYLNGSMPQANYEKGFFVSIFLLVGVGSVIHSMVDMCISIWLYKPISSVYDRLGVRAGA